MAFTINAPKSWLLMPFFIVLVIVLAPFALLFSLLRMPFAKRRKTTLKEVVAKDWIPRQKYVYIGYNDDLPIAKHIEQGILPKYGSHIIFDKWLSANKEWTESEPDTYRRVTTIWQDIAGDFDGDPICIVAVLTPSQRDLNGDVVDVYTFNHTADGSVLMNGDELSLEATKEKMTHDIEAVIQEWNNA